MRTILSLLSLLLLSIGGVWSASVAALSDMTAAIESLGRYEVRFIISLGGAAGAVDGYYVVDGDRFFLSIADQQIYGDGAERCSVNHNLREVVLERLPDDESQPLVVVNPVAAFAELAQEFEAEVVAGVDVDDDSDADVDVDDSDADYSVTTLRLTPKSGGGVVDSSLLVIDNATHLPRSVSYESEGERVSLMILSIIPTEESVMLSYPADYEVIDIR